MTPPQSQPSPSLDNIEKLIAELGDKLDLTGEEIADVLWLIIELQKSSEEKEEPSTLGSSFWSLLYDFLNKPIELQLPKFDKPQTPSVPQTLPVLPQTVTTKPTGEKKGSVYTSSSFKENQGIPIGIPDAPSLREPLNFARGFRPLMRRVATGRKVILDEAATVQRIAEELICVPVLRAEAEQWLDLALVIDESHSMLIWGHTIRELKKMFKKYGIFGDIRVWGLQPDEAGEKLQLFSRTGNNNHLTQPKEIIDPTGRRVVLIVSDCVSNIWRKGMMFPVLKAWTEKQPLAILQMLPEWMWRRSALDLGTAVGFKSSIMGVANQELCLHKPLRRSRRMGFQVAERSKVPVIALHWEQITQWSQMLLGKGDAIVPGYLLPPQLEVEELEIDHSLLRRQEEAIENQKATDIVNDFQETTSPLGRKLAGLLAASPVISLPVVRLIQESMLPISNHVQVAEVFLGGLLRPKSASIKKLDNEADLNPDLVEYEFIEPEIRDIFLGDSPVSDAVDVVNAVSRYVAEQLGVSLSAFMAILKAPEKVEEKQREDVVKPFAQITARVLRKLGGEYIKFADELSSELSSISTIFERKKILILASNQKKYFDLKREIDILKSVIERSQAQDEFEVKISSGVSYDKIQRLLFEHKPRIVHFCGHGAREPGLVFDDAEKSEKLLSKEAISDLFKSFANEVECVLLNACYSEIQATEISHYINYVIGMKQSIRDDSARVFARGFYQALRYGQSIEDAYNVGCNVIKIQDNLDGSNSVTSKADRKFTNRKLNNLDGSNSVTSKTDRKFTNSKLILQTLSEYLKPELKIKSPLTRFPDEEVLTSSNTSLDLTELVQDEINRKRYREDIEDDFQLERNNVNRRQTLTGQEYRWRQALLNQVKNYWIKGVLEKSLFRQVLFEQTITNRPDAVQPPFSGVVELSVESDQSFEFIQVSDIFEGMGARRSLLILGEPGTGKTVSLLKLAERLIKRTEEEDLNLPIPVVFNLSSWAIKRKSIADWLVEELQDKYGVSKALGKKWIEQEELILLLDSLDEVKAEYRNDCVRALNQFLDIHGITEMVVCCRLQDYQALSERLDLRNAICIRPLSSESINWYLEDVGKPLVGLKQLLQRDKALEELARTPLIFSVMSIAYQGYSLEEMSVKEKRYERFFDSYIERMFSRSRMRVSTKYPKDKVIQWLSGLAKQMVQESQTFFYIDKNPLTRLMNQGRIPWNNSRFLDYATELLFLQKVDDGYIFINRMLMEHFANMKLD